MLVSRIRGDKGETQVVAREGTEAYIVNNADSVYDLALAAADKGTTLTDIIGQHGFGPAIDLESVYSANRILIPITHRDAAHVYVTGAIRVEPEWSFRGSGIAVVGTGVPIKFPSLAQASYEEPEIAGIYVVGKDGSPFRVGFALTNAFADPASESENESNLDSSKLRQTAIGPEILTGNLPGDILGSSRMVRDGNTIWEKPFRSGEDNMSHTIAQLENHHFKYDLFCQPGDLHIHVFGTEGLSICDGIKVKTGDIFEIDVASFGLPLRNSMVISQDL